VARDPAIKLNNCRVLCKLHNQLLPWWQRKAALLFGFFAIGCCLKLLFPNFLREVHSQFQNVEGILLSVSEVNLANDAASFAKQSNPVRLLETGPRRRHQKWLMAGWLAGCSKQNGWN